MVNKEGLPKATHLRASHQHRATLHSRHSPNKVSNISLHSKTPSAISHLHLPNHQHSSNSLTLLADLRRSTLYPVGSRVHRQASSRDNSSLRHNNSSSSLHLSNKKFEGSQVHKPFTQLLKRSITNSTRRHFRVK